MWALWATVGTLDFIGSEIRAWKVLTRGEAHLTCVVTDHSGCCVEKNCKEQGKRDTTLETTAIIPARVNGSFNQS